MIHGYDKKKLTRAWLTMSNDNFFKCYNFNWVPPLWLQDQVKAEIISENELKGIRYINKGEKNYERD